MSPISQPDISHARDVAEGKQGNIKRKELKNIVFVPSDLIEGL